MTQYMITSSGERAYSDMTDNSILCGHAMGSDKKVNVETEQTQLSYDDAYDEYNTILRRREMTHEEAENDAYSHQNCMECGGHKGIKSIKMNHETVTRTWKCESCDHTTTEIIER